MKGNFGVAIGICKPDGEPAEYLTDNPSQFMDGWEIHHGDPYDRVGQKY